MVFLEAHYVYSDIDSKRNSNWSENYDYSQLWRFDITVIIVYHVTIVAIGHWLLKKCWPSVIVCYALRGVPLYETMQTRLLR